jgi:hypothetical protein
MATPMKKKPTTPRPRHWTVSIIRKRGEFLGMVDAPDQKAAEAEAAARFGLTDEQRKRLVVREAS